MKRLADLARAVGISQGTASTLVEPLVRDGLNPTERRTLTRLLSRPADSLN